MNEGWWCGTREQLKKSAAKLLPFSVPLPKHTQSTLINCNLQRCKFYALSDSTPLTIFTPHPNHPKTPPLR